MACLSGEKNWVSLPKMLSHHASLNGDKRDLDDEKPNSFRSQSTTVYRLEKVFPVYALGFPSLTSTRRLSSNLGDPIWDAVRSEAKLEAEREPILSSFLYASILAHDCLEQALGFVLANRLQNPTLLATQLMDIFYDVMLHDRGIQRSIRLDVQPFCILRYPAIPMLFVLIICLPFQWKVAVHLYCWNLELGTGYHSIQVHRVAHALWRQGRKVLALALQSRISEVLELIYTQGLLLVKLLCGKQSFIDAGEGAMIAAGSLVLKDVPPRRCYQRLFEHAAVDFRDARSTDVKEALLSAVESKRFDSRKQPVSFSFWRLAKFGEPSENSVDVFRVMDAG
ncbi:hypothetical protein FNV43_RR18676 [Rhamnella rubrinervis]|uniref:Serine acetyltransferase N-terminal domain-containing protein n=1 Tax=Rhamnella rubrinervis TaxID=2594499 RepID=A0A8K0EBC6_9ROSA|nr:hypothetical protein FNV43_RR18676 [Rhamnella rubrinervis]